MILDRDDPLPLYLQVKRHLLAGLGSGALPAGVKLASERELIDQLGVSRTTVRLALRELVMEGHLRSHPGKGFYPVAARPRGFEIELVRSFTETAKAHGKQPAGRLLSAARVPAPPRALEMLGLEQGTEVVAIRRLRLLDDTPVMITDDWLPPDVAPGLLSLDWSASDRSLYAELRDRYGLVPAYGRTVIGAGLADAEERRLLGLPDPAPLLVVEQVAFDRSDKPLNASCAVHDPEAFPLRLEQGR